jgi:hypothetical protein
LAVFDAENLNRSVQLYKNATQQLSAVQSLYGESKRIKDALDGGIDRATWSNIINNNLHQIDDIFKTDSLSNKTLAQQNFLTPQVNQNFMQTKKSVGKNLYVSSCDNTKVDGKKVEQITNKRARSLDFAIITSIAEASEQKTELVKAAKRTKNLTVEAMRSNGVHQDLINTNKLLAAIYSELNQQRQIQAQMLELLAASLVQGSSVVSDVSK